MFYLFFSFSNGNTAWKVRDVSPPTRLAFFDDKHVSHNYSYLFNPACLRTLFNVPIGISTLSFPAIVTVPGLTG